VEGVSKIYKVNVNRNQDLRPKWLKCFAIPKGACPTSYFSWVSPFTISGSASGDVMANCNIDVMNVDEIKWTNQNAKKKILII
jgi:hypothetical protein